MSLLHVADHSFLVLSFFSLSLSRDISLPHSRPLPDRMLTVASELHAPVGCILMVPKHHLRSLHWPSRRRSWQMPRVGHGLRNTPTAVLGRIWAPPIGWVALQDSPTSCGHDPTLGHRGFAGKLAGDGRVWDPWIPDEISDVLAVGLGSSSNLH